MDSGSHIGTRRAGRGRRMSFMAFTAIQVLALLALLLVPAGVLAADPTSFPQPEGSTALGRTTQDTQAVGAPTIASDKADYAPGETVTLTGTNWAPGEEVRVVTNDTLGQSWMRDVTVTASAEGVKVGVIGPFSGPFAPLRRPVQGRRRGLRGLARRQARRARGAVVQGG